MHGEANEQHFQTCGHAVSPVEVSTHITGYKEHRQAQPEN